jgi:LysR family glycine cleavage system transcriptional activator
LRAFEAATRLGSFSAAARELNVTPAAIAQHVRALETDLGRSLVVRDGRGIATLPEGLALAEGLARGFATIADAVEQSRSETEAQPLTLAVTPSFATDWLMPRIGSFWADHPEIGLTINPSISLVDLRRDGVDLAIRWGDGSWPGLESELLTDGEFWVIAHPKLLAGRPPTLDVARELPWVQERFVLERERLLSQVGLDPEQLVIREMETGVLARAALRAGLGVTMVPRVLVEEDVADGSLVLIHQFNEAPLGYHMVTLPGRVSPRVRVLKRWLKSQVSRAKIV